MTQLTQNRYRHRTDLWSTERAQRRHEPVLRGAELPRLVAPRFLNVDERRGDRAEIAVGGAKDPGDTVDRSGRRIVGDEVRHEFHGDESSRRRMAAEVVDGTFALRKAAF